jgi:cyclopropane fatty-acyl-phospholipid synthase-like methyltransferase
MNDARPSRDAAHFDQIYQRSTDPWAFRSSPYERAKYAATIAALPPRKFRAALEIGCSIGELTRLIAKRADGVHGVDIAAAALAQAEQRCADLPQIRFSHMSVPGQWPLGLYDLILLSEVLYFLSADDIALLAGRVQQSLTPGGVVMLVNYLGETGDPTSGDDAAEIFLAASAETLRVDLQQREAKYRLDRLSRPQ